MTGRVSGILLLLIATLSAQLSAPTTPKVSPRTLSYVYMNKVSRAGTVDELSSILEEAFETLYSIDSDAVPDLYGKTKGYCATVKPSIARWKRNSGSNALFSACSLSTLAAVLQLVQARYDRDLRMLQSQRSDVHEKIRAARERICELQKTASPRVKSDVDPKFIGIQSPQIQVNSDSYGTVISISDILFETGSAGLTPDLIAGLTRLTDILLSSADYRVKIEGHTDDRGPEAFNQTLSEQRAQSVLTFLVEKGVTPDRLSAIGYGMSRPVDTNETAEGRRRNRRVDLIVQEQEQGGEDMTAQ